MYHSDYCFAQDQYVTRGPNQHKTSTGTIYTGHWLSTNNWSNLFTYTL